MMENWMFLMYFVGYSFDPYKDKVQYVEQEMGTCMNVTQFLMSEDTIFSTIVNNIDQLGEPIVTLDNYTSFLNDTYTAVYSDFQEVKDTMLKVCVCLLLILLTTR